MNERIARCHAVLTYARDPITRKKRMKLALYRSLEEALIAFQEAQRDGDAIQLFMEPPIFDGEFTSIYSQSDV